MTRVACGVMGFVTGKVETRRRVGAGVLTLLLEAGVLTLLLTSGNAARAPDIDSAIKTFDAVVPPPIVRVEPPRPARSHRPEGAASPPNLRSKATPVVAPPVVVPVISPVVAAKVAGVGSEAMSGAAPVAGPGTGAGGVGNGTGSGGAGDGDGDGGDETPPILRKGRLKDSDYPRSAADSGAEGIVSVRYLVGVDGKVARCDVTKSSGNGDLDETTCRLIRERFRFYPSRDAAGRPVPAEIVQTHSWSVRHAPDTEQGEPPDEQ